MGRAARLAVLPPLVLAAWSVLVATRVRGDAVPGVLLLVVAVTVAVGADRISRARPAATPAVVLAVAAALALRAPSGLYDSPLDSVLGYANATAAFYALAAACGLLVAVRCRARPARAAGIAAAVGAASVPLLNGSVAGTVSVALLPVALLLLRRGVPVRRLAAAGVAVVLAGVALTVALGATAPHGPPVREVVAGTLSERRPALWAEALALARAHPAVGVGPGRFAAMSRIAGGDEDVVQVHSAYLQVAAELGAPGALLALLTALAVFGWLAAARPDAATAVGAAALTGLGLQAGIDYVLHFPAVVLAGAALLGAAAAPAPVNRRDRPVRPAWHGWRPPRLRGSPG